MPTLMITAPEGEGVEARNTLCMSFFEFLNSQEGYVQAFSQLPQHQQIVAILIQEEWKDQPDLIKDRYLRTSDGLWTKAIDWFANNALLPFMVLKEMELGHIMEFFIERRNWG